MSHAHRHPSFTGTIVAALLWGSMLGCGTGDHGYSLPVSDDDDGGGGGAFGGADASAAGPLGAHIEANQMTVTIVTVGCAGDCADVRAVATGGHPPYTFAWSDGVTSAAREVCPTSDTTYGVKVTDTGSGGEFARAPATANASVTATALDCADGGTTADGGPSTPETGFHWVHWASQTLGTPGSATGTLLPSSGAITVTYAGEVYQPLLPLQQVDYFVPATTYTSPTVGNPPTEADGLIVQQGGTSTVDTLTFSRPVTNPVFAIMSLGNSQDGTACFYEFGAYGETFTILQQGMGERAGPGTLVDVDGGLTGNDGDGLVQLNGTFSKIEWTDPIVGCEGFGVHGFTVGVAGP
jgi:hypothetical protein